MGTPTSNIGGVILFASTMVAILSTLATAIGVYSTAGDPTLLGSKVAPNGTTYTFYEVRNQGQIYLEIVSPNLVIDVYPYIWNDIPYLGEIVFISSTNGTISIRHTFDEGTKTGTIFSYKTPEGTTITHTRGSQEITITNINGDTTVLTGSSCSVDIQNYNISITQDSFSITSPNGNSIVLTDASLSISATNYSISVTPDAYSFSVTNINGSVFGIQLLSANSLILTRDSIPSTITRVSATEVTSVCEGVTYSYVTVGPGEYKCYVNNVYTYQATVTLTTSGGYPAYQFKIKNILTDVLYEINIKQTSNSVTYEFINETTGVSQTETIQYRSEIDQFFANAQKAVATTDYVVGSLLKIAQGVVAQYS